MTFTAEHLALQPPGSMLEWRIYDDGFIAGDYRIHLLGPKRWQVELSGEPIGEYASLRTAFSSAEHHLHETSRRSTMIRHGIVVVLAMLGWLAIDLIFGMTGIWWLALVAFPVVAIGVISLERCVAASNGNLHNPHYPSVDWKPRPRSKRRFRS